MTIHDLPEVLRSKFRQQLDASSATAIVPSPADNGPPPPPDVAAVIASWQRTLANVQDGARLPKFSEACRELLALADRYADPVVRQHVVDSLFAIANERGLGVDEAQGVMAQACDGERAPPAAPAPSDGDQRGTPGKNIYPFELIKDFTTRPANKDWLVKGIIATGETSAWIAPPKAMKSALMAELAICVATGTDWHCYKAKRQGSVVYFALERADLVRRRLMAHVERRGLDASTLKIAAVAAPVDMTVGTAGQKIVETLREIAKAWGQESIDLVILDTFAKLIANGGGDEDKAQWQGKVFANIARVKHVMSAAPHFALVGHTGKDETRGSRGSNALVGDVDMFVQIGGGDVKTAIVTGANDAPDGALFSFKSEIHKFGVDEDGDPITVNIVAEVPLAEPSKKATDKWPAGLRLVRDCIAEAIAASPIEHRVGGDGPAVKATSVKTARDIHNHRYVSNGEGNRAEAERKSWTRNFKSARSQGLIGGETATGAELIWIV